MVCFVRASEESLDFFKAPTRIKVKELNQMSTPQNLVLVALYLLFTVCQFAILFLFTECIYKHLKTDADMMHA